MEKLETIITTVLAEIEPKHTKGTFENRKRALNHLLRFAQENGYDEPCQELYDAFTADDRGSPDIRFTLTHAVRLVDRAADTRAKDNSGRLYNEPPLPSAEESLQYFNEMQFPVPKDTDLNHLIVFSEQILRTYDLTESTIGQYLHAWIDLRRFCMDRSVNTYHKDIIDEFIQDSKSLYDQGVIKAWKWKINRKASLVLSEIAETGYFKWGQVPYRDLTCGDDAVDQIRDQFVEELRSRNLAPNTICLHEYVFRYSMKYGNIFSYDQLSSIDRYDVETIIKGFADKCNSRSIATIIPILRNMLRFLYRKNIVDNDHSGMVLSAFVQRSHVNAYIPSSDDETMVNSLERETARNRAIILLALRLGLRDIDICTLKLSSIDWNNDCLHIPQKKTDNPLRLPLLSDVGNALFEYITEERPQPFDGYPYVFRRMQAPYNRIHSAYPICSRFLECNGIHTVNGQSSGVHVFRYTLTNRLLKAKVPHQVITDTLGHSSKESDKPYLSMEADMLRQCAMDLSLCGKISWEGGSL